MSGEFDGRIVLVTGAAKGVGRATAEAFAAEGAIVVATDIDREAGQTAVADIVTRGQKARFLRTDIADPADIAALFDQIMSDEGRLDIAINNAAIDLEVGDNAGLWDERTMERVWDVNAKGVFRCMKRELDIMVAQGGGKIVNIASLAGLIGVQGKPAYTAAKHAVIGLTRAAALQYGPVGIRVNAVCPSGIRTEMFDIQGIAESAMIAAHPLRRIADPADIADAALWLASDRSRNVTGHPLVVDAGYMTY